MEEIKMLRSLPKLARYQAAPRSDLAKSVKESCFNFNHHVSWMNTNHRALKNIFHSVNFTFSGKFYVYRKIVIF